MSQTQFTYQRQLSYDKCERCGCKKNRVYKTTSTNLNDKQKHCAEIRNTQDATMAGIGLFDSGKEDCRDNCSHKWERINEPVKTTTQQTCDGIKTQAEIDREKERKKQEERDARNQLAEQQKMEFQKLHNDLQANRKQAKLLLENNQIDQYITLQSQICDSWLKLNRLHKKCDYGMCDFYTKNISYYDFRLDINNLAYNLLITKQFEKALTVLNFVISDVGDIDNYGAVKQVYNDAFWYRRDETFMLYVNVCHAALLTGKRELFWQLLDNAQSELKRKEYANDWGKRFYKILVNDYKKFKELGILSKININHLMYVIKVMSGEWPQKRLSENASKKTRKKFEIHQHSLPSTYNDRRLRSLSPYENIFFSDKEIKGQYASGGYYSNCTRFYYYIDENGDVIYVNITNCYGDKTIESNQIRNKDLSAAPKK